MAGANQLPGFYTIESTSTLHAQCPKIPFYTSKPSRNSPVCILLQLVLQIESSKIPTITLLRAALDLSMLQLVLISLTEFSPSHTISDVLDGSVFRGQFPLSTGTQKASAV